ncbi:MAG: outer membrane lipoprotein carrier protein LolA [Planctomycetota bacterium]
MPLPPAGLAASAIVLSVCHVAAQADTVAEGNKLLTDLIAAQKDMAQMTADYVQHRTTKLFKKPLRSEGKLAFRREPGCVVFVVTSPRPSVVRLDVKTYEVWHPDSKRLERFVLPSEEMPRLLFDSLAPTQARMDKGFAVESCTAVEGAATRRLLTLVPTDAKTKRVASKITLTLDIEGPKLCGFGYQDPRGDDVRIELSNLTHAPRAVPESFELDLPPDATITEHVVPAPAAEKADDAARPPAARDDGNDKKGGADTGRRKG